MAIAEELLSTADAAKILGLSSDMVRLLAREGRLPAAVASLRGVRMFRREDVEALAAERAGRSAHHHIVQFYEDAGFLDRVVTDFAGDGLRSHGPVLVFATSKRRGALLDRLAASGCDVQAATKSGSLQMFDARATLDRFLLGSALDPVQFRKYLSPLIAQTRTSRTRLRVYGEMVDLLCRDGLMEAAIQFEELWNELAGEARLTRLCAYSLQNFRTGEHTIPFSRVCELHTSVVPTERYGDRTDPQERLRTIAMLEQQAQALRIEMELRRRAEHELGELKGVARVTHATRDEIGAAP